LCNLVSWSLGGYFYIRLFDDLIITGITLVKDTDFQFQISVFPKMCLTGTIKDCQFREIIPFAGSVGWFRTVSRLSG